MSETMKPLDQKWLGVKDACHRWGIGKTLLYELIRTNRLTAVKLGSRRTLINADQGDAFFASLPSIHAN